MKLSIAVLLTPLVLSRNLQNPSKIELRPEHFQPKHLDYFQDAPAEVICQLPSRFGMLSCMGYMPRVTYNHKTNTCDEFIFGGCNGTPNNFATFEECQNFCGNKKTTFNEKGYLEQMMGERKPVERDLPRRD